MSQHPVSHHPVSRHGMTLRTHATILLKDAQRAQVEYNQALTELNTLLQGVVIDQDLRKVTVDGLMEQKGRAMLAGWVL